MKSMMMMPPRLRRRSWRAIAWLASRLVLKMVSSKLRAPTKPPVLTFDRGHRLGLVDDQVAAGLEVHPAGERLLDLLFHAVELEERALAAVVLEQRQHLRRVFGGEGGELLEVLPRVDADARGLVGDEVAQGALAQAEVLVQQLRREEADRRPGDLAPQLAQVGDVGGELGVGGGFGHRAHDEAARLVLGHQRHQAAAQGLAPGLVLDALGDADVLFLRQVDEQAAGEADLGGQARALGADRVLEHLHHQALALGEDLLDRARALAVLAVAPDVGHVQEGGALEADVDEGRLHAGQHAHDLAEVEVADDAAAGGALDVQLLHHALFDDRDAGLLRGEVDEEFDAHGRGALTGRGGRRCRAARRSRTGAGP